MIYPLVFVVAFDDLVQKPVDHRRPAPIDRILVASPLSFGTRPVEWHADRSRRRRPAVPSEPRQHRLIRCRERSPPIPSGSGSHRHDDEAGQFPGGIGGEPAMMAEHCTTMPRPEPLWPPQAAKCAGQSGGPVRASAGRRNRRRRFPGVAGRGGAPASPRHEGSPDVPTSQITGSPGARKAEADRIVPNRPSVGRRAARPRARYWTRSTLTSPRAGGHLRIVREHPSVPGVRWRRVTSAGWPSGQHRAVVEHHEAIDQPHHRLHGVFNDGDGDAFPRQPLHRGQPPSSASP